jgi:hypothetical protein
VPALVVGVPAIHVDEQTRQRPNVLLVVADDVDERPGLAETQEVEVARWDLPAGDIAMATHAQQLRLDGAEACIGHSVLEHPPDE